ncbi:MAG TPA: hypothetical protein PK095_17930 [Myxococcota bacterium]|nr:hypothetical protein [Myxococcota bacterium]
MPPAPTQSWPGVETAQPIVKVLLRTGASFHEARQVPVVHDGLEALSQALSEMS